MPATIEAIQALAQLLDAHPELKALLPGAAAPAHPTAPAAPAKPRKPKRLPKFLRPEEVANVLAFLDRQVAEAPRRRRPAHRLAMAVRDRLLVHLGLYAGLRVGEICTLRIENIDLKQGQLTVIGKGDKERAIPIHPKLAPLLATWIGVRTAGPMFMGLFRRPLSPGAVRLKFGEIGRVCNLRFRLKPHALRHSAATQMLASGADIRQVQEFLGHSTCAVTTTYLHCDPARLRTAVGRMWDFEEKAREDSQGSGGLPEGNGQHAGRE